jgi:hypothetical protein
MIAFQNAIIRKTPNLIGTTHESRPPATILLDCRFRQHAIP